MFPCAFSFPSFFFTICITVLVSCLSFMLLFSCSFLHPYFLLVLYRLTFMFIFSIFFSHYWYLSLQFLVLFLPHCSFLHYPLLLLSFYIHFFFAPFPAIALLFTIPFYFHCYSLLTSSFSFVTFPQPSLTSMFLLHESLSSPFPSLSLVPAFPLSIHPPSLSALLSFASFPPSLLPPPTGKRQQLCRRVPHIQQKLQGDTKRLGIAFAAPRAKSALGFPRCFKFGQNDSCVSLEWHWRKRWNVCVLEEERVGGNGIKGRGYKRKKEGEEWKI